MRAPTWEKRAAFAKNHYRSWLNRSATANVELLGAVSVCQSNISCDFDADRVNSHGFYTPSFDNKRLAVSSAQKVDSWISAAVTCDFPTHGFILLFY
jgi:hypothetical protein